MINPKVYFGLILTCPIVDLVDLGKCPNDSNKFLTGVIFIPKVLNLIDALE